MSKLNEISGEESIGSRLASFRAERRLTLRQVAAAADTHLSTVAQWEKGAASPRVEALRGLFRNLGADIESLVLGGPAGQALRFDWELLWLVESVIDEWSAQRRVLISPNRRRELTRTLYRIAINSKSQDARVDSIKDTLKLVA